MGESAPETIKDAIDQSAKGPKSVSVDGVVTTEHSINEQIEADRYLTAKNRAKKGKAPFTVSRLKAGGTQG